MKTTITLLAVALHLAALAPSSRGYSYDSYDKDILTFFGKTVNVRADASDFPSGSSWGDALAEAVDRWNDNPSEFQFSLTYGDSSIGFGNLQSEIWGSTSSYWLGGAPAVTYAWGVFAGGVYNLFEADILVDAAKTWSTSDFLLESLAYGYGGYRPLQTVLLHELGHALGLNHEDRYYNIMGQDWDFINGYHAEVHFYPGEDAVNGAVAMYGVDTNHREDVSVTHWKYSSASVDGYSVHRHCRIYQSNGTTEASVVSGTDDSSSASGGYGDPIFEVSKGQTINVEMTFENSGATYQQKPHVSYYLSTNNELDSSDTVLATRRPTLNRNIPFTFSQSMVVPSDLTSGSYYWLFASVDDLNEISEVNGSNNKAYVLIRVK